MRASEKKAAQRREWVHVEAQLCKKLQRIAKKHIAELVAAHMGAIRDNGVTLDGIIMGPCMSYTMDLEVKASARVNVDADGMPALDRSRS